MSKTSKFKKLCILSLVTFSSFLTACNGNTPTSSNSSSETNQDTKVKESIVQPETKKRNYFNQKGKFYSDYSSYHEEQLAGKDLAIQIAQEGDVLLKNDGVLPFNEKVKYVSLLGMHSIKMVDSGTGSGFGTLDVDGIKHTTLKDSMEHAGFVVNQKLLDLYSLYQGKIHNELPIENYPSSVFGTFNGFNDAAIITFSRESGEGEDHLTHDVEDHTNTDDHALMLDDNEKDLVRLAKKYFTKVVVIINSSNVMQIPELAEEKNASNLGVDAILWVGSVGNNGAEAIGQILNGEISPSGHTVNIWEKDFTKGPSWNNFSKNEQVKDNNGNRQDTFVYDSNGKDTGFREIQYREGIYSGYKYYETIAADLNAKEANSGETWYNQRVLYPFGYGLSYTSFSWEWTTDIAENAKINNEHETITAKVKVTNTGTVAGKDVVQLYYTAPYTKGGIEKTSANLIEFSKTDLLQPGESQILTMQIVAQDMASFDYSDANDNNFKGYELEKGNYVISARRNSHDVALEMTRTISEDIKCTKDYSTGATISPVFTDEYTTTNDSYLANVISRSDGLTQPENTSKEDRTYGSDILDTLNNQRYYRSYQDKESDPWYVKQVPNGWTQSEQSNAKADIKLIDMAGVDYTDPALENGVVTLPTDEDSKKWDQFMNQFSYEELYNLIDDGARTPAMANINKAASTASDGGVQIRGVGVLFPSAPIMASTYNKELAYKEGRIYGNDCMYNDVTAWYGPGLDLHRSPIGGRNFEYYSEDGNLAGLIGARVVKGATDLGVSCKLKHIMLNEQEEDRSTKGGLITWVDEQAIREQWGKSYEYIVKEGETNGFMSSYNRIGLTPASSNSAMRINLLNNEWGFKGSSCTDFFNGDFTPVDLLIRKGDDQILGTGSTFPEWNLEKGVWSKEDNCVKVAANENDKNNTLVSPTHYYAIRESAKHIFYVLANSNNTKNGIELQDVKDLTFDRGVQGEQAITLSGIEDASTISLASGSKLPEGLTLSSTGLVSGVPTCQEGDYKINIVVLCDGWVKAETEVTIHIINVLHYTGNDLNSLSLNTPFEGLINTDYYAYGNLTPRWDEYTSKFFVRAHFLNWYEFQREDGSTYRGNDYSDQYDQSCPAGDKNKDKVLSSHEYGYSITEGRLPNGLSLKNVYKEYITMNGSSHQAIDGVKITGTPLEKGTFTFTITLNVPWCANGKYWTKASEDSGEIKISRTLTIIVK